MRHQSNQWEGRRLSRTLCHHAGVLAAGMVVLVRKESVRGDRLRTSTCGAHTKELPACDHGRGKRGLQRERVRRGERKGSQAGSASSGVAASERVRAARAYRLRFFPKCGRQKRLEQKILLLGAASYGGAGFQLLHKFSSRVNLRRGER